MRQPGGFRLAHKAAVDQALELSLHILDRRLPVRLARVCQGCAHAVCGDQDVADLSGYLQQGRPEMRSTALTTGLECFAVADLPGVVEKRPIHRQRQQVVDQVVGPGRLRVRGRGHLGIVQAHLLQTTDVLLQAADGLGLAQQQQAPQPGTLCLLCGRQAVEYAQRDMVAAIDQGRKAPDLHPPAVLHHLDRQRTAGPVGESLPARHLGWQAARRQRPRLAGILFLQRGQIARYRQFVPALLVHQTDPQPQVRRQLPRLPGILGDVQSGQLFERDTEHLDQRRVRFGHRLEAALGVLGHRHQLTAQRLGQALEQQRDLFAQQSRHQAIHPAGRQLAQHGDRHLQGDSVVCLARGEMIAQRQPRAVEIQTIGILRDPVQIRIRAL